LRSLKITKSTCCIARAERELLGYPLTVLIALPAVVVQAMGMNAKAPSKT